MIVFFREGLVLQLASYDEMETQLFVLHRFFELIRDEKDVV